MWVWRKNICSKKSSPPRGGHFYPPKSGFGVKEWFVGKTSEAKKSCIVMLYNICEFEEKISVQKKVPLLGGVIFTPQNPGKWKFQKSLRLKVLRIPSTCYMPKIRQFWRLDPKRASKMHGRSVNLCYLLLMLATGPLPPLALFLMAKKPDHPVQWGERAAGLPRTRANGTRFCTLLICEKNWNC